MKTHPWISFKANLADITFKTWILLGEARSKCEHLSMVPLKPAFARELHQVALIKGALATTAIEGNTLSEDEVRRHIEGTLKLPPSREYLAVEVDNVMKALNDAGFSKVGLITTKKGAS